MRSGSTLAQPRTTRSGTHALSTTLAWTLGQDPDQEGSNSCAAPISQLFEIPFVAFRMSWPNTRMRLPMRFGIVAPTTPDLIVHCETAEALGFEAAWLFDSHMVYSDVYVIIALCAHRTRRMTFGTGIAVAPPRRFRTTSGVCAGMTGSTLGKRHPIMSPC
jgi:hypothetical protein